MASRKLNFKLVVATTEGNYACEYSEEVFNAMSDDATIVVYAREVTHNGHLRGRKNSYWISKKFVKRFLTIVSPWSKAYAR